LRIHQFERIAQHGDASESQRPGKDQTKSSGPTLPVIETLHDSHGDSRLDGFLATAHTMWAVVLVALAWPTAFERTSRQSNVQPETQIQPKLA